MKKVLRAIAALLVLSVGWVLAACTPEAVETGFRIETGAMSLTVERGTEIDFSKLKVEAEFDDGTTKPLKEGEKGYSLDKGYYTKDTAGSYTISVRYKEYEAKTFRVTVTEPAPPAPTVTGIEVKTEPTKKEYFVGEDFDKTGLTVEKVMSDGTKVALTEAEYTVDASAYDKNTVGTYTITIKLKADGTKTDAFTVTVKAAPVTVTGIEVKTEPTKKEYYVGEDFDKTGLTVEKVMSDGTKVALTEAEYTVDASAYDKNTVGTYTITIKLKADGTKTDAFTVTVVNAPAAYRIKTMPRTAFLAGEQFEAFGLEVEKTENGVTETLAADAYEIDFSAYDGSAAGRYEIQVTPTVTPAAAPKNARGAKNAAGTTLKYTVSVSAVELDLANLKQHYREGDAFDISGLSISFVDADGVKTPVPAEKYIVDADSFYPWINAGSSIEKRIYIRLVDFPNFRLYYDYYVNYTPLSEDLKINLWSSSTIVPYGYQLDPNGDNLSIEWTGSYSNGKYYFGVYQFGGNRLNDDWYQVECDKTFDTNVPGVYTFTFKVRTEKEDPWRTVGPVAVTVLEEGAAYATGVSTEPFVSVKYGQEFDPANVTVNVVMSDGQTTAKSLGGGDFVWMRRGDTVEYTLKNAYRSRENENTLRGQFQIERDTSEVTGSVFEGIWLSGGNGERVLIAEQNGAFQATVYQKGKYEIRPSYVNDPGYKLKIVSIGGAAPEDPYANSFDFTGATLVVAFEIIEKIDNGDGSFTETVVKRGTLTVAWGSEIVEVMKLIEIEVAGQKCDLEYQYSSFGGAVQATARYVFEKADTAIPVRFTLKNPENYILTYWNETDRYGVSKFETIFYYQQMRDGRGGIRFTVYSKATGAEALTGSIEFTLRSQIVSIAYDGGYRDEYGFFTIDFGKETPSFSLSKFRIALNPGYTYRLTDRGDNVISNDKHLGFALLIDREIVLKIFDENGIEWERKILRFSFTSTDMFDGYYLEANENQRLDNVELYADGQPFWGSIECFTAELLRAIRWTVFYGAGEISDVTVAYLYRNGNEIDFATFDNLSVTITVRVSYTAYGRIREWNPDTQTEDVRFERATLFQYATATYTALAELPNVYVEVFGLAPIPADANFMMDLGRFDVEVEVFRTTKVSASDFAARYVDAYRDEMTMTVEPAGTDRFLAKFYRSGALVTYLNVFIKRDGVSDDVTQADVTYQLLTSEQVNFVRFTNGEAYVSAETGAVLTVQALNRWAKVALSTDNPNAIQGGMAIGASGIMENSGEYLCIFKSADNFNLTITVTATDGVTKQSYLLHVVVRPETPFFELRVGGTTYTALLSEMFGGADGDFYTDPYTGSVFLRAPLSASALGAAYDASAKTLKVTFTGNGTFAAFIIGTGPGASVESGTELTFPLIDSASAGLDMTRYPQYAGTLGGGVIFSSANGANMIPIKIFVLPNA